MKTVTLIPGDGITNELVEPVLSILKAADAPLFFDIQSAGEDSFKSEGTALPLKTLDSIRTNKIALKGVILSRADDNYPNPTIDLRKQLDLYAIVNPIKNLSGLPARHENIDIILIRESTEDIYGGLEHKIDADTIASLKVVTESACSRITKFAFEYAKKNNRKKVTLVHKANIMKITDGLFIAAAESVAKKYPTIEFQKIIVDNASMQMMLKPQQFDIMLMGNLYGSILSDLGAGITGGISSTMAVSLNDDISIFEALHGDSPHLSGLNKANPLPLLMPACYLLDDIGEKTIATKIRTSVSSVLLKKIVTPDLGGTATTNDMMNAIIDNL